MISYETKVAACADYLLGVPINVIAARYNVSPLSVYNWIKVRGCFKLRRQERKGSTMKLCPKCQQEMERNNLGSVHGWFCAACDEFVEDDDDDDVLHTGENHE